MSFTPRIVPANVAPSSSKRWWNRLEAKWSDQQVGRQGSYSIERLESFDHYCKTTSLIRVVLVCVLAPLPGLSAAILLESLPLRSPSEGWAANWMFWIRLAITNIIMLLAGGNQLVTMVPDLNPTFWKRQFVAWGATAAYMATFLFGASVIGFPVPLMWYTGGFVVGLYVPLMQLMAFGLEPFKKTSPCHRNLQRHMHYFNAYMALLNIFPLCKVLYDFVPVAYRGIAVIILPIWRLAAKQYMVRSARDMEDFIPGIVAMSVDFFTALFVSVCMTTQSSMYLSMLFIAADIGQSVLEFQDVRANAGTVIDLLRDRHASSERFKMTSSKHLSLTSTLKFTRLVDLILEVTRDPQAFHVTSLKGVRLRACYPHRLAPEQKEKLDNLEASHSFAKIDFTLIARGKQSQQTRHLCWPPHRRIHAPSATIAPRTSHIVEAIAPEVGATAKGVNDPYSSVEIFNATLKHNAASGEKSSLLVFQGLQLLFHCEYLILVEYVECVVPLVYVLYKVILEHLPNVAYYPGGAGQFGLPAITNILVFAMLEIGSLFFLHLFLKRKLAFSSIYQLAFVLETQVYVALGNLIVETLFLLQYELEHFGTDFSFQFKWLRDKQ